MDKFLNGIGAILAILIITGLVLALPTMWLWNYLMPELFGFVTIDFWHALGLNLFCGVLFKSNNSTTKN